MPTFPSLSSTALVCILITSATLTSSVRALCTEDPEIVLNLNPKKNGQPRNCAWLQRQSDAKKNKICNRLKDGDPTCPVTCDLCDCPEPETPIAGGNCYNPGLDCPYNYQYMGCNFQDGFSCTAIDYYSCNSDQKWEHRALAILPCVDPVPDSPAGQICEPCPTVAPAESCPSLKPRLGEKCSIESTVECQYDFDIRGCSADQLECAPGSFYYCTNGLWEAAEVIPEEPCEPTGGEVTGKVCPKATPSSGSPCYNLGMSCNYEYRNLSCNEDEVSCTATEMYQCFEEGWVVAVFGVYCDAYPPTFYEVCTP